MVDESHLVCSRRKVESAPLKRIWNTVIQTTCRSCFTYSKYRGKTAYLLNYWYNMITVVVILNCNQSLIKELHKEIQRYESTEGTHNSN